MPGSPSVEVYFIAAMMILILIFSGVSVFLFVRQYKKEMREKSSRGRKPAADKDALE